MVFLAHLDGEIDLPGLTDEGVAGEVRRHGHHSSASFVGFKVDHPFDQPSEAIRLQGRDRPLPEGHTKQGSVGQEKVEVPIRGHGTGVEGAQSGIQVEKGREPFFHEIIQLDGGLLRFPGFRNAWHAEEQGPFHGPSQEPEVPRQDRRLFPDPPGLKVRNLQPA